MTTTKTMQQVSIKDATKGEVEAVFSTFDVVDLDGDVLRKEAFTDGAPVVISAYGHRSHHGELPVGKGRIKVTDSTAVLEGRFFLDTSHGRDAFLTVKALSEDDALQEWSYSLRDVISTRGEVDGVDANIITHVSVKEVSPVLEGASIGTRTLAMKAGDQTFSDHREAVLTALDVISDRAVEVVTLRTQQGKSYSSVTDLVEQIAVKAAELRRRVDEATPPPPDDAVDLESEFARFVSLSQGVTL